MAPMATDDSPIQAPKYYFLDFKLTAHGGQASRCIEKERTKGKVREAVSDTANGWSTTSRHRRFQRTEH